MCDALPPDDALAIRVLGSVLEVVNDGCMPITKQILVVGQPRTRLNKVEFSRKNIYLTVFSGQLKKGLSLQRSDSAFTQECSGYFTNHRICQSALCISH